MSENTPELIQKLKQACERATPGPWSIGHPQYSPHHVYRQYKEIFMFPGRAGELSWTDGFNVHNEQDAAFIAMSRSAVPILLAHISSLESGAELQKCREEIAEKDKRIAELLQSVDGVKSIQIADLYETNGKMADRIAELERQLAEAKRANSTFVEGSRPLNDSERGAMRRYEEARQKDFRENPNKGLIQY